MRHSKKELVVIMLVVVLLLLVLVLSGMFYFSLLTGNTVSTGHVVLRHESGDVLESPEEQKSLVFSSFSYALTPPA